MTPMEIILKQKADEASRTALSEALRRKKDISMISQLSGDPILQQFGAGYGADADRQAQTYAKQREAADQRSMTQGYYDQLASQAQSNQDYRGKVLTETIRHNKAMEESSLLRAQGAGKLDINVRNLSREMIRAGIPEIDASIRAVNRDLQKYVDKDTGEYSDIPGLGGVANTWAGNLTADGRKMKAVIGRIRNIILKARSGGAVTPQEADRLMEEFSLGVFNTDADFLKAWNDFQGLIASKISVINAGYDPLTQEVYQQNLASQLDGGVEEPSGAPGAPETASSTQGVVDWDKL